MQNRPALTDSLDAKWLVLDGYNFGIDYQTAVSRAGRRLLIVDDDARHDKYRTDLVLNQNIGITPQFYAGKDVRARLLTGANYVMLRREFRLFPSSQHPRTASGDVVRRVLITLGGSDESNVTGQVLESLRQCAGPDCAIDVLIGPGNPHEATLRKQCENFENRVTLHVSPPAERLPELMAGCEMAISAAGSSVYEFGFLGVPLILIVTASNQRPTARNLAKLEAATALDSEVPGWVKQLAVEMRANLDNPSLRARRAAKFRSLIDGQGACRVVDEMRALA